VSDCRSQRELIGPYVLGALEPAEMEQVRRHLAQCEQCAAEERQLATLPGLLDHAHADDTIAAPSPQVEDAVLDRFVRERAHARRPRRSWRRFAIPAAAAAAVAAALAVVLLPGGDDRAYARAKLWNDAGAALGTARVAEVDAGTHVDLRVHDLPRRGAVYELWCVRTDGRWVSGGSFRARRDGSAAAELTAAVRPGEYHMVVVTRRSAGGERGAEVMRGKITY
jgi:anti-sigma-K factor RskA